MSTSASVLAVELTTADIAMAVAILVLIAISILTAAAETALVRDARTGIWSARRPGRKPTGMPRASNRRRNWSATTSASAPKPSTNSLWMRNTRQGSVCSHELSSRASSRRWSVVMEGTCEPRNCAGPR